MNKQARVGIVGTGRMGANIARRLHEVGYSLTATYDARPEVAREIAAEVGAEAAPTLGRVSELADVVVTVVTDDDAMRAIFAANADSLLENAAGKIFVNCATITPHVHVEVERRCEERGAASLEACMAGSIPQAREGSLFLMVGGRRETFDRVAPMLEQMSSSLIYVGESGRAAELKVLVNMLMNINTAGLAEGLALASALGLDLDQVREVFSKTGAASRVLATDGADMQNRDHEAYFTAEHAAKDSGIALALATEERLHLPLAQAAYDQYERMKSAGLGHLDKSGVSELTFRERAVQ